MELYENMDFELDLESCMDFKSGFNQFKDISDTTGLYYYMTMKDFKREEIRKTAKKKYKKVDSKEKKIFHDSFKEKKDEVFNLSKVKKTISSKKISINNYEDLFYFFSKINLFELVNGIDTLDKFFPCKIIKNNYAWISKSPEGHFRYFSKSREKGKETLGLDFIDLMEVYYGLSTLKTIETVVKSFKIKFMEYVWMNEQNRKYLSNLTLIHNPKNHIEKEYPALLSFIKSHLKILETMNVIGNINVKKKEFSYENNNIFFASNSYIADFLGNYTISTTNKILNLFAVLGLIKKIPEDKIPPQLLHKSKIIAERRNLGNIISYYIIPNMMDILSEADRRANLLKEHNVKYSNISKGIIEFIFGEEFSNQVYVQEIQKNKIKNTFKAGDIHKCLEMNFIQMLNDRGFVLKSLVAKKNISKTNITQREKELNKIWKSLLLKHAVKYIKPTSEIKEKFSLYSNEYIGVLK